MPQRRVHVASPECSRTENFKAAKGYFVWRATPVGRKAPLQHSLGHEVATSDPWRCVSSRVWCHRAADCAVNQGVHESPPPSNRQKLERVYNVFDPIQGIFESCFWLLKTKIDSCGREKRPPPIQCTWNIKHSRLRCSEFQFQQKCSYLSKVGENLQRKSPDKKQGL